MPDSTAEERRLKAAERAKWAARLRQAQALVAATNGLPDWFFMPEETLEERKAKEAARIKWAEQRKKEIARARVSRPKTRNYVYTKPVTWVWYNWRTPYGSMYIRIPF
jgi:hypothetical protein